MNDPLAIATNKHLGILCKEEHNYKNTGKSLRDTHGRCTVCSLLWRAKYREENRERIRAVSLAWRKRTREKRRETGGKYREKNREKTRKWNRETFAKHKEAYLKQQKEYYDKNKVEILYRGKLYRNKNREKIKLAGRKLYHKNKKSRQKKAAIERKTKGHIEWTKQYRESLPNAYVRGTFKPKSVRSLISQELIETKRVYLQIYRFIKGGS